VKQRAFIYGTPIGHSISPAIHNAAFAAVGRDVTYEARDVAAINLTAAIHDLRQSDVIGCNITVPHKVAVLSLVDEVAEAARVIGAANTIHNRAGRLWATNTDVDGFARSLAEAGWSARGAHVLILGSGGAARAVSYALLRDGAERILLANRTPDRASRLAEHLQSHFVGRRVEPMPLADLAPRDAADCQIVVNTTTVGLHGEASPLEDWQLPAGAMVVDLIYNPPCTPLLQAAKRRGLPTLNGLAMLVYQAAEAWRIWTGQEPPIEIMACAAHSVLQPDTAGAER
jgi:shikimate dehydrogenase